MPKYNPATGTFDTGPESLQGGGGSPQSTISIGSVQPTVNPTGMVSKGGGAPVSANVTPSIDYAAMQKAKDAAQAAKLRGDVTNLANTIKNIFNQRYGQVERAAREQTGNLNERFQDESQDVTQQVAAENEKVGAAHAAGGTFDSSYRGNNVDTVTEGGEGQIRDLGTELKENLAKIASWVTSQEAGFSAQKGGIDSILSHLAEETSPDNLSQIRSSLEGRMADLKAGSADNNTQGQNMARLNKIAPSSPRAQQLKTTLSQIVAGSADTGQKQAIAQRLITSAGLTAEEQKDLLNGFATELSSADKKQKVA